MNSKLSLFQLNTDQSWALPAGQVYDDQSEFRLIVAENQEDIFLEQKSEDPITIDSKSILMTAHLKANQIVKTQSKSFVVLQDCAIFLNPVAESISEITNLAETNPTENTPSTTKSAKMMVMLMTIMTVILVALYFGPQKGESHTANLIDVEPMKPAARVMTAKSVVKPIEKAVEKPAIVVVSKVAEKKSSTPRALGGSVSDAIRTEIQSYALEASFDPYRAKSNLLKLKKKHPKNGAIIAAVDNALKGIRE